MTTSTSRWSNYKIPWYSPDVNSNYSSWEVQVESPPTPHTEKLKQLLIVDTTKEKPLEAHLSPGWSQKMGSPKPISGSFSPLNHRAVLTKGILCKFLLGKALKDCCRCWCWCCLLLFLFLLLFLLLLLLLTSFMSSNHSPTNLVHLARCLNQFSHLSLHVLHNPKEKFDTSASSTQKTSKNIQPLKKEGTLAWLNVQRDPVAIQSLRGSESQMFKQNATYKRVQHIPTRWRTVFANILVEGPTKEVLRQLVFYHVSLRFLCHICRQTLQADRILLVRFLILPSVTH